MKIKISFKGPEVVKKIRVDDGTTTGRKVIQDENGRIWEKDPFFGEGTGGTDEVSGEVRNGRIYYKT